MYHATMLKSLVVPTVSSQWCDFKVVLPATCDAGRVSAFTIAQIVESIKKVVYPTHSPKLQVRLSSIEVWNQCTGPNAVTLTVDDWQEHARMPVFAKTNHRGSRHHSYLIYVARGENYTHVLTAEHDIPVFIVNNPYGEVDGFVQVKGQFSPLQLKTTEDCNTPTLDEIRVLAYDAAIERMNGDAYDDSDDDSGYIADDCCDQPHHMPMLKLWS
jgi:hypothetical protein